MIKYDTSYELNNMHKNQDMSEGYLDNGLKLYVYDGPFLLQQLTEKKNGNDNGIYLLFYIPSNMPKEKGTFINGQKEGEWFYWDDKGILIMNRIWKRGKIIKTMKYKGRSK